MKINHRVSLVAHITLVLTIFTLAACGNPSPQPPKATESGTQAPLPDTTRTDPLA
jgi:predicted small lipoprotein YifL